MLYKVRLWSYGSIKETAAVIVEAPSTEAARAAATENAWNWRFDLDWEPWDGCTESVEVGEVSEAQQDATPDFMADGEENVIENETDDQGEGATDGNAEQL